MPESMDAARWRPYLTAWALLVQQLADQMSTRRYRSWMARRNAR